MTNETETVSPAPHLNGWPMFEATLRAGLRRRIDTYHFWQPDMAGALAYARRCASELEVETGTSVQIYGVRQLNAHEELSVRTTGRSAPPIQWAESESLISSGAL